MKHLALASATVYWAVLAACGDDGGSSLTDASPATDMGGGGNADAAVPVDPLPGIGNVELVDNGYMFTEGPQWRETPGDLLFSDIPANTIYRYTGTGDPVSFRNPSGNSNGIALDGNDSVITADEFRSRNGTRFVGLGEHRPGVWHIVPRAQRLAGDYDIIHSTLIIDDDALAALAAGVEAPASVTVALPTARPTSSVDGNRLTWRNAANPDLISIDYTTARSTWTVHASRAWLGSQTSYAPVDATQIPTWRWSPSPSIPTWVTWQWTSDRRSLPFDGFTPPPGVIYRRVADKPR